MHYPDTFRARVLGQGVPLHVLWEHPAVVEQGDKDLDSRLYTANVDSVSNGDDLQQI